MLETGSADERDPGHAHAGRQPWLHDLVPVLRAPTQVWSARSGQITGEGITGYIHADIRVVKQAVLSVAGVEPVPMALHSPSADDVVFTALLGGIGDPGIDPTVRVTRRRQVSAGTVVETVGLRSWAAVPVQTELSVHLTCDLAPLDALKAGEPPEEVVPALTADAVLTWSDDTIEVVLSAPGAAISVSGTEVTLTWRVQVQPGSHTAVSWSVHSERGLVTHSPAASPDPLPGLQVTGEDRRWGPVLQRSISDVDVLRMSLSAAVGADFVAAGVPWFLTLFGRDSLWAARMMLPVTTSLAASTLRALASRQGVRVDPTTEEAPGKILHEVRADTFDVSGMPGERTARWLPPVYYGSIDATPLWVLTLVDAWRWGLPDEEVLDLIPAMQRALAWVVDLGDVDGDGFLEYVDATGTGLSNQGWKDSGDSVRHVDGSLATAPIALCEVQAYAYAAACGGADLLDAFGRDGGADLRAWAQRLRDAFRAAFWVSDEAGAFPAIALDADKRPVASLTSNIGHLLGTGLLDEKESAVVARRLAAADMFSGFGIRTLSSDARGYSPTGYHVGTVWPHDTAIAVAGMAAAGAPETAVVADGLLAAMHGFDGRVPELFAGDDRDGLSTPLPYPAACRPQGWSAASAVLLLSSVLGLQPGRGSLAADPVQPWPFGALTVSGLRVGTAEFVVDVDAAGRATVTPATVSAVPRSPLR